MSYTPTPDQDAAVIIDMLVSAIVRGSYAVSDSSYGSLLVSLDALIDETLQADGLDILLAYRGYITHYREEV